MKPDEIDLVDIQGGCRLRVKVRAGGRADAIMGRHGGALRLSVTAPPERGKANVAVAALIAATLGVSASRVAITGGRASSLKTIRIEGMSAREALALLDAAG